MRALDTSAEAHAVQIADYRQMSGNERVRLAVQISEDVRELAR